MGNEFHPLFVQSELKRGGRLHIPPFEEEDEKNRSISFRAFSTGNL